MLNTPIRVVLKDVGDVLKTNGFESFIWLGLNGCARNIAGHEQKTRKRCSPMPRLFSLTGARGFDFIPPSS
jgi:hypothetical protein